MPWFPISRDPPEGGTVKVKVGSDRVHFCFQFLGIPPKGEPEQQHLISNRFSHSFQFLGIPPKGELSNLFVFVFTDSMFPISRDPPEGGTPGSMVSTSSPSPMFPISRDPPEGGTVKSRINLCLNNLGCFQFLGIPPKGELHYILWPLG